MNCQECKYRCGVVGSAHSECKHPISQIPELKGLILTNLLSGKMSTNPSFVVLTNKETGEKIPFIDIDPHGIKNGWALWPFNFDPVWVNNCMGFEKKENNEKTD